MSITNNVGSPDTGFTNESYSFLFNAGTFYQLSVAIFFEPGYNFDPAAPSTLLPDVVGSSVYNAKIFIKNLGGANTEFGFAQFPPDQNQLPLNNTQFSFVNIILTDNTNQNVVKTKIHHEDADVPDIIPAA